MLAAQSFLVVSQIGSYTYPRLLKFKAARFPARPMGEVEGDLAESFELSGDKLQITFRLRQGLKWDARAPTNGRAIDSADVLFSWRKFSQASPFRTDIVYHPTLSPGAPVESVSAPDGRTFLVRLRRPDASVLSLFAFDRLFHVMPRESESAFDPRLDVRGYGPWLLEENNPGATRVWRKNSEYYVRGLPYPDRIEQIILSEFGALAHFRAGNVWTTVAPPHLVLKTKEEVPDVSIIQEDSYSTSPAFLAFGYEEGSPWRDERVRQALSMLIDRETLISVLGNREGFAAAGLDIAPRYHTVVGAGWEGYWLDPRDATRFGPNAVYYRYDPASARKLLDAAGYGNGLWSPLYVNGGLQYGPGYLRAAEILAGMLNENGVAVNVDGRSYESDWLPNYYYAYATAANAGRPTRGFSGIAYRPLASYPSVATQLFASMHKDGVVFQGMTPDGKNAQGGDADVNRMIERVRSEFDPVAEKTQTQDLIRYMARKAYLVPFIPYASLGFRLFWPVIGNFGLYRTWPGGSPVTESAIHWWVDASKPPILGR